jgi:hypothetical protein
MHVIHLIAVEAEDEEEAVDTAESALGPYGDGDVWDWYAVGGRWDGYLGGENACCYGKNPAVFLSALQKAEEFQNADFREMRDHLTGRRVPAREVGNSVIGIPIGPDHKAEVAERISARNAQSKEVFGYLKKAKTLMEFDILAKDNPETFLFGWYLKRLGQHLMGNYHFESYFLDTVEHTTRFGPLRQRTADDPMHQWLVAVDLHN